MNVWVWNPASDGWGGNPATVSAVATALYTAFTIAAVVFAWLSWRQSKTQTNALEDEIRARMRPWVGLYDFGYQRSQADEPVLRVLLRNVGPLPAQDADLAVVVRPIDWIDGEEHNAVRSTKKEAKTLMPSEDGDYTINLGDYPRVDLWIITDRDLIAEGTFTYTHGKRKFESKFVAELWFSRSKPKPEKTSLWWIKKPPGSAKLVNTNWRNVSAT